MTTKGKRSEAKVTAVAKMTTAERVAAAELVAAGTLIGELQRDYFAMVRDAVLSGCTFEGMEAAEPALKEIGAYRSAKSVIRNAKAQGVRLVNGDGKGRSKGELNAETKPTGKKGKRAKSGKAAGIKSDKVSQVQAALAILKADPAMRKAFAAELRDLSMSEEVRAFSERKGRVSKRAADQGHRKALAGQRVNPDKPAAPSGAMAQAMTQALAKKAA